MKLYITPGSPYARIARVVILEKGLKGRVEIVVAQTRLADSPYYKINPSGRVPYLMAGYLGEHVLGMPKSYERLGSKKARVPDISPDISFGIR